MFVAHGLKGYGPSWWWNYGSRTVNPLLTTVGVVLGHFSPHFLFVQSRSPDHRVVFNLSRDALTGHQGVCLLSDSKSSQADGEDELSQALTPQSQPKQRAPLYARFREH